MGRARAESDQEEGAGRGDKLANPQGAFQRGCVLKWLIFNNEKQ